MKKTYPTTKKARSATGWHHHLRKPGKRVANKGTRKVTKVDSHESLADAMLDEAILSQLDE